MSEVKKYGRLSVMVGAITEEKDFKKQVREAGFKGDVNAAWVDYKKSLAKIEKPKPKAEAKPKTAKKTNSKEKDV